MAVLKLDMIYESLAAEWAQCQWYVPGDPFAQARALSLTGDMKVLPTRTTAASKFVNKTVDDSRVVKGQ